MLTGQPTSLTVDAYSAASIFLSFTPSTSVLPHLYQHKPTKDIMYNFISPSYMVVAENK